MTMFVETLESFLIQSVSVMSVNLTGLSKESLTFQHTTEYHSKYCVEIVQRKILRQVAYDHFKFASKIHCNHQEWTPLETRKYVCCKDVLFQRDQFLLKLSPRESGALTVCVWLLRLLLQRGVIEGRFDCNNPETYFISCLGENLIDRRPIAHMVLDEIYILHFQGLIEGIDK